MAQKKQDFTSIQSYDHSKQIDLTEKKKEIQQYFTNPMMMTYLTKSLPRVGITADRMTRIIFSAITQNPKLAQCSPQSLFNAMIQSAQIGLEPNTALGHSYLVPFWNDKEKKMGVQLIIGYKGFITLCQRSGLFSQVYAYPVFPGDIFDVQLGTDAHIKHTPDYTRDYDAKTMLFVYAVVKLKDGSYQFEIMPKHEIDRIKNLAKTQMIWDIHYIQMARKTVIRRLMNYLSLTSELVEATKIDGETEAGIDSMIPMGDVIEESEEQSHKKEEKKQTIKSEEKPREKAQSHKEQKKETPFDLAIKSLDMRGISETEICAYFNIEDLAELDFDEGIKELQKIASDIEGEKITVEEFKKIGVEKFEMRVKEKK